MYVVAGRVDMFPLRGISHYILQGHKNNESEEK